MLRVLHKNKDTSEEKKSGAAADVLDNDTDGTASCDLIWSCVSIIKTCVFQDNETARSDCDLSHYRLHELTVVCNLWVVVATVNVIMLPQITSQQPERQRFWINMWLLQVRKGIVLKWKSTGRLHTCSLVQHMAPYHLWGGVLINTDQCGIVSYNSCCTKYTIKGKTVLSHALPASYSTRLFSTLKILQACPVSKFALASHIYPEL